MAENNNWCNGFENDHTYLKTTIQNNDDTQILKTKITTIEPTLNNVIIQMPSTEHQNMIYKNNISKTVNKLNISNSNVFFLLNSLNCSLPTNNIILQNNFPVQKFKNGNKPFVRPIKPKISNNFPATSTQSNRLFIPTTNSSILNTKLQNETPKNTYVKPKLPLSLQDKIDIKPVKNKKVNAYDNGVCTIKLSPNILKRIQSGEKLFMCMECDKIYTEHKDLLDHQQTHNKCNIKRIAPEKEMKEKIFTTLVNNKKLNEKRDEKMIYINNSVTKQIKPVFKSTVNPKKRKVIFQGECIMCHIVFPDLGKHLKTVHQKDLNKYKVNHSSYNCDKCNMEFDIKQQLRAHELAAHNPTYTYTCEHCFRDFSFREDLEKHIETHYNDSMKYLCPYCDAGFPHSNGLRTHLVKHFGVNNLEPSGLEIPTNQMEYSPTRPPEQLDQLFADFNNISEDTNEVYIEQVANDNYRFMFTNDNEDKTLSSLEFVTVEENHTIDLEVKKVPSEDNNKIIIDEQQSALLSKKRVSYTVCRICLSIVSYSRIGRHMKKKHNNAAPYQCEICYAEFNRKHIMDDHRRKHTNNKPHKCIECSKCFTYKHHLSRHMMLVHNADSLEKPFKCSVCDKAFSFKEYLTLHFNSRHKGKHYMCQICGKSFSTNAALNKHQLCHTDERPFMCEHCGRTFKCKTHCDTHTKNMHPGDPHLALPPEKFECNLCNKKFSTKVYRDMHFKRHNGQGHQCDICCKLFVSKAHMQRHSKIMHRK